MQSKLKIAALTIWGCYIITVVLLVIAVNDPGDAVNFLYGLTTTLMMAVFILAYFNIKQQ